MKNQIKQWFGNTIMIFKIDNNESINKDIKKLITKSIVPSEGPCAKTTDVEHDMDINDNLHNNKNFDRLFEQIEKAMLEFLQLNKYNDSFEVHITKAWATFTKKDQFIAQHRHSASHYSLVYYVEAEDQGNLNFDKPEPGGLFIPCSTDYFSDISEFNIDTITYPSRTGDLIIFPSNLIHHTEKNTKENPRISISLDVILTMKEGKTSEHNLPCPKTWKKLKI